MKLVDRYRDLLLFLFIVFIPDYYTLLNGEKISTRNCQHNDCVYYFIILTNSL